MEFTVYLFLCLLFRFSELSHLRVVIFGQAAFIYMVTQSLGLSTVRGNIHGYFKNS